MKKETIKTLSIWFVLWLTFAWSAWYAANSGLIWDLFELDWNSLYLRDIAIPDKLIEPRMVDSISASKILPGGILWINVQAVTQPSWTSDWTIATTQFVQDEIQRICLDN